MAAIPVRLDVSSRDMLALVERLGQCFQWLGSKHIHMYVCRTQLTIDKLKKARNELEDTIKMTMDNMEEAKRNGWLLKERAVGWVREGLVFVDHAHGVVVKYEELMGDPAGIFCCPCETLSRRILNSTAIWRLNDILEHTGSGDKYAIGDFDAVATKRQANDIQSCYRSLEERFAMLLAPPVSDGSNAPHLPALLNERLPSDIEKMQLSGLPKYRAFERTESLERVPVMIRVNAPPYTRLSRAAIDLVMVLDTSANMKDYGKLDQLKQGCMFVILNLEARDRLSIVTFGETRELLPLTSMSTGGKRIANNAVRSLKARGNSTAGPALDHAYKILDHRQDRNPVNSILLLADGRYESIFKESLRYVKMSVPKRCKYPTYTFGFGLDHDPRTLYYLATCGYGTYSFVTENKSIRDAMALCIGGLTSIVAQKVRISISSAHQDVKILSMMCGGYNHDVAPGNKSGFISVMDLYASEEKKFIVYVNIPAEEAAGFPRTAPTKLLTVTADYYCPVTRADVHTNTEISVERPGKVWGQDRDISVEVASEITRANIFKGVEDIWLKSNQCTRYFKNFRIPGKDLKQQLATLRDSINRTEETGDDLATGLDNMLKDIGEDISPRTGLPYMLSWLSSHQWQRAATPGSTSNSRWFNFRTIRMRNMIESVDIAPIGYAG